MNAIQESFTDKPLLANHDKMSSPSNRKLPVTTEFLQLPERRQSQGRRLHSAFLIDLDQGQGNQIQQKASGRCWMCLQPSTPSATNSSLNTN